MKILKHIINTKTYDENDDLIKEETSEFVELSPEEGKMLKNVKTGKICGCVGMYNLNPNDFIEIDKPILIVEE